MSCILTLNPPPGALVRVISDLHLGHERCEVPSVAALEPVVAGADILVIAGDTAEGRACDRAEQGAALREELHTLCRRCGVQLIELSGNHDPEVELLMLRLWDGQTIIMHGHALCKVVAPWSWEYLYHKAECEALAASYTRADSCLEDRLELSRAMSSLIRPILRREGTRNPLLRGLRHCFWPPQRPLGIVLSWLRCGRLAERFARQYLPGCELLLMGHYHRGGQWRYGKRRILCMGAWFRHARPYVAELRDGKLISYHRVKL